MASFGESNDEDELKELDREINELRSAKKELLVSMKPFSDELERIAKRERECVDKRHRLRTEKHDREKHQQTVQRLIELESELKQAKCENAKLSDTVRNLKQSLDQAANYSKAQKRKITELENRVTLTESKLVEVPAQTPSETENSVAAAELQKQLNHRTKQLSATKEEFIETRRRLSDVQERLTVAEQVTAATQQRELQQSDISEQLQLLLTSQHQPTAHTGYISLAFFRTFIYRALFALLNTGSSRFYH